LTIKSCVNTVNPWAFSSFDWSKVKSITAYTPVAILWEEIQGLPENFPIFVRDGKDANGYDYLNARTQTYSKKLSFVFNDGAEKTIDVVWGQEVTMVNPEYDNMYNINFDNPFYKFLGWKFDGKEFYDVNKVIQVGRDFQVQQNGVFAALRNELPGPNAPEIDYIDCWKKEPIEFRVWNGTEYIEYRIRRSVNDETVFVRGVNEEPWDLDALIAAADDNPNSVSQIYLPGIEHTYVDANGVKWQFIGWSQRYTTLVWNDATNRVLPEGIRDYNGYTPAKASPNDIIGDNDYGKYKYYALYDMVTDNLTYKFVKADETYTVGKKVGASSAQGNSVRIPYAHLHNGFMRHVTAVEASAFKNASYIDGDIYLGGSITLVGGGAFQGVSANILFGHGKTLLINGNTVKLIINNLAFANNNKVTALVTPSLLSYVGQQPFANCSNLQTVRIDLTSANYFDMPLDAFAGITATDVKLLVPNRELGLWQDKFTSVNPNWFVISFD
jgi:hypothetical protein